MKKLISLMLVFMTLLFVLVSCERVAPNYADRAIVSMKETCRVIAVV